MIHCSCNFNIIHVRSALCIFHSWGVLLFSNVQEFTPSFILRRPHRPGGKTPNSPASKAQCQDDATNIITSLVWLHGLAQVDKSYPLHFLKYSYTGIFTSLFQLVINYKSCLFQCIFFISHNLIVYFTEYRAAICHSAYVQIGKSFTFARSARSVSSTVRETKQ